MVALDYGARIAELRSTLADILAVVDVPSLRNRIAELETRASTPDLWDYPEKAQQVTSELSHAQSELARVIGVERRLDDLEVLVELVNAETDEAQAAESAPEAEQELVAPEKTLGDLEG